MKTKIQIPTNKEQKHQFQKAYQIINISYVILYISYILVTLILYYTSSINHIQLYKNLILLVILILNYSSYIAKAGYSLIAINLILLISNIFEFLTVDYSILYTSLSIDSPIKNISIIYIFIILSSFICISIYNIYSFYIKISMLRQDLKGKLSYDMIYHEIQLQIDMIRMSYNRFLIRIGLNKSFPFLVYRKDSFYYLSNEAFEVSKRISQQQKEISNAHCEDVDEKEKFIKKNDLYSKETCDDSFM